MPIGQELLNAPFPEIVRDLGVGIAEAQYALDQVALKITRLMAGFRLDQNGQIVADETQLVKLSEDGEAVSLLALGFTPTFYQYVDTLIELKMDVSMTRERTFSLEAAAKVRSFTAVAAVNAKYQQKYQYQASGSSSMKTKLVTVPAPAILEERIRTELLDNQGETGT